LSRNYLTVAGIRLSFIERCASTSSSSLGTIFFIHGNSGSSSAWVRQLAAPELQRFRLIAFDLPAHGSSDTLEGSEFTYSFPDLGLLIALSIQKLWNNESFLLAGLSIGTNIVVESLAQGLRPAGLILVGSCIMGTKLPMEEAFFPGVNLEPGFVDAVTEESLEAYARLAAIWPNSEDLETYKRDFRRVKDSFRSNMFKVLSDGGLSDESAILEKSGLPVLAIYGAQELVCKADALEKLSIKLWKGSVQKIEGGGHFTQTDQPESCNELIGEFAAATLGAVK
jgi:pimeloyl-ACP methyl ester carboxylesterase